jgi:uncharacterized protein (DUF433 family)
MNSVIINENISSGAPTIRGRRLTVLNVVSKIYYEDSLEAALEDYEITLDEAKDAISYCSSLKCQEDTKLIKFCSGCILRTLQEKWKFDRGNYSEFHCEVSNNVITVSKDGNELFLGSKQELEDNLFGEVGWLLAREDKKRYHQLGG